VPYAAAASVVLKLFSLLIYDYTGNKKGCLDNEDSNNPDSRIDAEVFQRWQYLRND